MFREVRTRRRNIPRILDNIRFAFSFPSSFLVYPSKTIDWDSIVIHVWVREVREREK